MCFSIEKERHGIIEGKKSGKQIILDCKVTLSYLQQETLKNSEKFAARRVHICSRSASV
jgi:hypothetical protein